MSELKKQLISWLGEIEEPAAAKLLESCEVDSEYVDSLFSMSGDDEEYLLNNVTVYVPPKVYKSLEKYADVSEVIEEAIRDNGLSDKVHIKSINWVPITCSIGRAPHENLLSSLLNEYSYSEIHIVWSKALERKSSDPEGAITLARTLVESVCKHILDDIGVDYNKTNIELSELYKQVASELNLSPSQHEEQVFKQILGGCSGIINGLGTLRNKLGDAHGPSRKQVRPQSRHAELAVNLSGSMCTFLIETYEAIRKT